MSLTKLACIALGATLISCSAATDPATAMNGVYELESSTGNGPVSGRLVLTSKGYAERRVRYREPDGDLSEEYLTRGSAQFMPDSSIVLELREMNLTEGEPWTPDAKLVPGGVELSYADAFDGSLIVERYARQD